MQNLFMSEIRKSGRQWCLESALHKIWFQIVQGVKTTVVIYSLW